MPINNLLETLLFGTPFLLWFIVCLIFFVLEKNAHASHSLMPSPSQILNIACGSVVCLFILIIFPLMMWIANLIHHVCVAPALILPSSARPFSLSFILSLLLIMIVRDFFFYVWHRTEHQLSFLWDIHAVHHSEKHLNCTSYMRINILEAILQNLFVSLPISILISADTKILYTAYLLSAVWNFFGHSELKINFGKMTPILTGPQLHRLHHSTLEKHLDKNFAQFFPFWDIIFNTYVPPDIAEYPPTGLSSGVNLESLNLLITWPFREWCRKLIKRGSGGKSSTL